MNDAALVEELNCAMISPLLKSSELNTAAGQSLRRQEVGGRPGTGAFPIWRVPHRSGARPFPGQLWGTEMGPLGRSYKEEDNAT